MESNSEAALGCGDCVCVDIDCGGMTGAAEEKSISRLMFWPVGVGITGFAFARAIGGCDARLSLQDADETGSIDKKADLLQHPLTYPFPLICFKDPHPIYLICY